MLHQPGEKWQVSTISNYRILLRIEPVDRCIININFDFNLKPILYFSTDKDIFMSGRAYIALYESGELKNRAAELNRRLHTCDICPRACQVNRVESNQGFCRSGRLISISSYCAHHGEEPVLSGIKGSGTIFFRHCNLKCIYCQNHQISQPDEPSTYYVDSKGLARMMLSLQDDLHCHNINLVSPSHYVPQIVEAIHDAVPMGLQVPIIYNTNGYDAVDTLKMLDGIIDIYLPDIKYASNRLAAKFSQGKSYVRYNRLAIQEMFRQVGNLATDADGMAQKGLIVRHLILPNNIAGSTDCLKWLATTVSRDTTISVMAQYYPCYLAEREPLLSRKITSKEYHEVTALLEKLNLENGWFQEMDSSEFYLPDFKREGHPFSK